jgi:hypothetical protein
MDLPEVIWKFILEIGIKELEYGSLEFCRISQISKNAKKSVDETLHSCSTGKLLPNSKAHGLHLKWEDKKLTFKGYYKDDEMDGICTKWYLNGKVASIGNYKKRCFIFF